MKDHYISIKIDDLFLNGNFVPPEGDSRDRAIKWIEGHLLNCLRYDLADLMEFADIELKTDERQQ